MDNDYNLSSVPLLSVDDQILMPIATMGAGHLHHHHEQQEQQQQQPAELDAAMHVNNNSHNSDETAILTTHLGCVDVSGGGGGGSGIGVGRGETTNNSFGNYFTENHTMNTLHADIVHPTDLLPNEPQRPHDEDAKANAVAENTEGQQNNIVVAADADVEEAAEDDEEEVDDEEDVEDLDEQDVNIEEEEITPDIDNNDVVLKNEAPEEIVPENEGSETPKDDSNKVPAEATTELEPEPANNDNDDEASQTKESQSESEQPMSSKRASQRKEEEVDENQCRVCCTKEDLVSIFKKIDGKTGAEMLMQLCPAVSIAVKDFLPQFVCHICMGKIMLAIKLKQQVETTEKELRKKLSRHKNKVRRPAGYVVISAPLDSDTASDDEANNDEEFKVSDVASATPSEESDSSEFSDNKKKKTRSRKRRKSAVTTPTPKAKSKSSKSENASSENEDDGDPIGNHKRKRSSNSSPETFACDVCEQVFTRKQSLVLHRKVHDADREPIACRVCGKKFKVKGAYRTHMEKHREEAQSFKCQKCSRKFASSGELKDHMEEEHKQTVSTYECLKCKRKFVSSGRLKKHKQGHCPGVEAGKSKKTDVETFVVGRDLFKSVAPLTTTYWSDSFSD